MKYLDFSNRSMFALRIVESFIKSTTKDQIDSLDKMKKILLFMKPLIEDQPDSVEVDEFQFDFEQTTVSKLVYALSSNSPAVLYDIFVELKNVFFNGGEKRKKYTLPYLANALLDLCNTISGAYDLQNNNVSEEIKTTIFIDKVSNIDISQIDSNETFHKIMFQIYTLLNEVISNITQLNPELGFKIYLNAASQANNIQTARENFIESCASFLNAAISIIKDGKIEQDSKFSLLTILIGTLLNLNILTQELINQFVSTIQNLAQNLIKRSDQCNAMLNIAQLYYTLLGDKNKVVECLTKSKRFADFAITNPKMLYLHVTILNKIMYFTEIDDNEDFIKASLYEDVIETVKNYIQTITTENKEQKDFLPPIQAYFDRTLEVINKRKLEGKKKIYSEITNL